tara:strand:+ start:79 stop:831 length:753 start_codon:yes stop_codon:yes gene_type:complete
MGWKKKNTKMSYFERIETKRKHVKQYHLTKNKIPPKESIERALYKAWKTTPGKNNAMAYQVLVWGPDKEKEKKAIHSLVVKSHKSVEEEAVEDSLVPNTITQAQNQNPTNINFPNPFYEHVALNPYLFTIHSRVAMPNKFYQQKIKEGHHFDQAYEHLIETIVDSVAVEVGMFASNLGYYLLEEGLDISYNSCFRRRPEEWHKVGLDMVDRRPITMISCGYAKKYRQESLLPQQRDADKKPEIDEIVKWI